MAQTTYSPGDLVKITSGGPVMTVLKSGNGTVQCIWFNTPLSKYSELTLPGSVLVKQAPFGS